MCHKKSACDGCHGVPMPHPGDFLLDHKQLVKKAGKESCSRCHEQSSCDNCHAQHIHPGVKPDQLKWLKTHPVTQQ